MTALTAFYDYLLPDIPGGIPNLLAEQAIRSAAIEFCDCTRLIEYKHPLISSVALQGEYTIVPEVGMKTADVIYASYNNEEIYPTSTDVLDAMIPGWREPTVIGTPDVYFLNNDLSIITLVKTPAETIADVLRLTIVEHPARDATAVSDVLYEKYVEQLMHGAKARLYSMKKKPWSDPSLSAYHMGEFNLACGRGDIAEGVSNTRMPNRSTAVYSTNSGRNRGPFPNGWTPPP